MNIFFAIAILMGVSWTALMCTGICAIKMYTLWRILNPQPMYMPVQGQDLQAVLRQMGGDKEEGPGCGHGLPPDGKAPTGHYMGTGQYL